MKVKQLESLKNIIETLPYTPPSSFIHPSNFELNFYPFSNDRGAQGIIQQLRSMPAASYNDEVIRVGVVIGQSNLYSMLPELSRHCDMIVIADINPYLISEMRTTLSLLQSSLTPLEFFSRYYRREKQFPDPPFGQGIPSIYMKYNELSPEHFLSDFARFQECRRAAKTVTFAFANMNIFDLSSQTLLFDSIQQQNAKITFFNFTNLYEWDAPISLSKIKRYDQWCPNGNISQIVNCLRSDTPIVTGSFRENHVEACALRLRLFMSAQDYLQACDVETTRYLASRFPREHTQPIDETALDRIRRQYTPHADTAMLERLLPGVDVVGQQPEDNLLARRKPAAIKAFPGSASPS